MGVNKHVRLVGLKFFRYNLLLPLLTFLIPAHAAAASTPNADTIATKIAERYGVKAFAKVESLHFAFNVLHSGKTMKREWTWFPKLDSVHYAGKDPKGAPITADYSRRNKYSMASES